MIYSLCILLIAIGLYGVVVKRNALKIVICLLIMEHGVNLLFILVGYRSNGQPPILDSGTDPAVFAASAVDPGAGGGSDDRGRPRRVAMVEG